MKSIEHYSVGWNKELVDRFVEVWDKWHLNDMHAGCEHQRALGWGKDKITIYTYELTQEVKVKKYDIENKAADALRAGGVVQYTPAEQTIINKPSEINGEELRLIPAGYELTHKDKKFSGWVYEYEHPKGVLCKPCPVCGYKYGSAWLTVPVPKEIIDFLFSLPDSESKPAWV